MDLKDNGLIDQYMPCDYCDSFSREVARDTSVAMDEFLRLMFTNLPWWIESLMWIRNGVVRLVGLRSGRFEDYIDQMTQCRCDNEIVIGLNDKHLVFYVSLLCGECENSVQKLTITTVVKYNNRLGRLYFFFVRPFHRVMVKSLLGRI